MLQLAPKKIHKLAPVLLFSNKITYIFMRFYS